MKDYIKMMLSERYPYMCDEQAERITDVSANIVKLLDGLTMEEVKTIFKIINKIKTFRLVFKGE